MRERSDAEKCPTHYKGFLSAELVHYPGIFPVFQLRCLLGEYQTMNPLLKMAVLAGAENAVRLHLQRVGEIDELDSAGMSLLMHAANRGHSAVFKILLDSGADPFFPNRLGMTAHDIALKYGHADIIDVISGKVEESPVSNEDILLDSFTANNHEDKSAFEVDIPASDEVEISVSPYISQNIFHDEEDVTDDSVDDWIEETEPDVPDSNQDIVVKSVELQEHISSHRPQDNDDDWSDIHIELPEFIWANAENHLLHDFLETERKLILHAIRSGRIVSYQIDDMAELAEADDDGYSDRLQLVLNDLGVRIDPLSTDYIHPNKLEEFPEDDEEPEVQMVEDAIRFLWEMNNPLHDPYWLYIRDVRSFQMLDASKEELLGKKAEAGILEIKHAVACFPPSIAELINIISSDNNSFTLQPQDQEEFETVASEEEEIVDDFDDDIDIFNDDGEYSDFDRQQQQSELLNRITKVSSLYDEYIKVATIGSELSGNGKIIIRLLQEEIAKINFSKVMLLKLAEVMINEWLQIEKYVDAIRNTCTRKAGMSLKTFSILFKDNEANIDWCRSIIDSHTDEWVSGIAMYSNEILEQQIYILEKEKYFHIPLHEFYSLYNRVIAGRDKLISAHTEMVNSNLRLANHLAKKYQYSGLPLLDLVQEANLGLMKAAERFDYHRGFRFSTFATWWIRQSITRAIADKLRTIRVPVHMIETLNKMNHAIRQLQEETCYEPTPEQISEKIQMPLAKVMKMLKIADEPVSLDSKIGDLTAEESIVDNRSTSPFDAVASLILTDRTAYVLSTLEPREEKVIRLRFGIGETRDHTLEEVGELFEVTRERIRQIESEALRKLRHPSRSKKLKSFVD